MVESPVIFRNKRCEKRCERQLAKWRISDKVFGRIKKSLGFSQKSAEFCAAGEFEVRRFSAMEIESRDWRLKIEKQCAEFDRQIKVQKSNEELENLQLQGMVYREELESLKRQVNKLKKEKQRLTEVEITVPKFIVEKTMGRRRSNKDEDRIPKAMSDLDDKSVKL